MNKHAAIPILIIVIGMGLLFESKKIMPQVDWIWILGLLTVGTLILLINGITRLTIVVGPFLIICSVLSFLRQNAYMESGTEVPILIISVGILSLLSIMCDLPKSYLLSGDVADTSESEKKDADK